jgi:hypothetical protein
MPAGNAAVEDAIHAWADYVLNPPGQPFGIPIAWMYGSGPRPAPPYVGLNIITNHHPGQGSQGGVFLANPSDPTSLATQRVGWHEESEVSIQGFGEPAADYVDSLHDSLETPWVVDFLEGLGLAQGDHTDRRAIPSIIDQVAERRWVMEVTFRYPTQVSLPGAPWIEFVQVSGTIYLPDGTTAIPVPQFTIGQ